VREGWNERKIRHLARVTTPADVGRSVTRADRETLAVLLARHLAAGELPDGLLRGALRALDAPDDPAARPLPRAELLRALAGQDAEPLARLREHLRARLREDARAVYLARRSKKPIPEELRVEMADLPLDVPMEWQTGTAALTETLQTLSLLADSLFARAHHRGGASLHERIGQALQAALAAPAHGCDALFPPLAVVEHARAKLDPALGPALERLESRLRETVARRRQAAEDALDGLAVPPSDLDDTALLEAVAHRLPRTVPGAARTRLLDLALAWRDDRAAAVIAESCRDDQDQERASVVLALRFGKPWGWPDWQRWLAGGADAAARTSKSARDILGWRAVELLLLWELRNGRPDPELADALEQWCLANPGAVDADRFAGRWRAAASGAAARPAVVAKPLEPLPATRLPVARPPAPTPPPPKPRGPSIWRDYVQSFLAENWYLVVGLLMVVAGSSLLAYFTWDKHWALRYTIMPALLGAFTAGLAGMGSWLERRDARLDGTAALLRAAAIVLLPVNFMAVALLSEDPAVTNKLLAVPVMAAVYVALSGWGLRTWCERVHPGLAALLGTTLLFLNALVILGPVARAVVALRQDALQLVLGLGFYAGFVALAMVVVRFTRAVLTPELAAERRVPWFFGATLVVTYLQVFAWVHTFLRHLPARHSYAPLVVLAGWLILTVERRALALRADTSRYLGESFLGFAFVLLGVVMAAGHPELRIACLVLAGLVWLEQAEARKEALHHAIGLVFLCLAGAAVGLHPLFPRPWLPALGLLLAGLLAVVEAWSARAARTLRAEVAAAVGQVVLLVTTLVAVLVQWHFRSWPVVTALWLLAVASGFFLRARHDRNLRALVTGLAILAGTLPYLGCVDMLGRSLHGNTMVFGLAVLSCLWLALTLRARDPLLLHARSTVLWLYGNLAVAAMLARVVVEGERPLDVLWYRAALDYGGPLLMAAVLLVTAYLSRSALPAWLAAVVVVVLLPELKAQLRVLFPGAAAGGGLGSAVGSLLLTGAAFRVRAWRGLHALQDGDRFLGREPFPLRRTDATLFTTPLVASALFLCAKTDTWNLVRNLARGGVGLRTVAALALVAVSWAALAVFLRAHRRAVILVHLGWLSALLACHFGRAHAPGPPRLQWTFVAFGLLVQVAELACVAATRDRPWVEDLLRRPLRQVLEAGSQVVAAACIALLCSGVPVRRLDALLAFTAAELAFRGLASGRRRFGGLLFALGFTTLLAATAPGPGLLLGRLGVQESLLPTLWMCLAIQVVHLGLEASPGTAARLRPLLSPMQWGATALVAAIGLFGVVDPIGDGVFSGSQQRWLLAVVLLTGRTHGSGFFGLVGVLLSYLLVHDGLLRGAPGPDARLAIALEPWRLALLALAMAGLGAAGRHIHRRWPTLLAGRLGFPELRSPGTTWMFVPATALAILASLSQTASPAFREQRAQLGASYLGAAALALVAWAWEKPIHYGLAGLLLTLANVHAVRVFLGDPLRARGLSEDHLVSLGLAVTLLQGTLLRVAARRERVAAAINTASLPLATLVLVFLCTNYLSAPALDAIPPFRFLVSGAMALLAARYFRRASVAPGPGEAPYVDVCAALYHFGVTLAIWCAALLVPWLRQPATALVALGLPVLYFHARAEAAFRGDDAVEARRYRLSASVLGLILLGLYVFRAAFQMVLFPDSPIRTDHYHHNAPLLIVVSLVLIRLHALGGTDWLPFYGGLGLAAGSYFALTWLPGLSPFEDVSRGAWCALALAHFWTAASYQRSPLRSAVQAWGGIGPTSWMSLRRAWGRWLLVGTHLVVAAAIFDSATDPHLVAPLLLGLATVVAHVGLLRESRGHLALAALEVTLALHTGFVVPSYLAAADVIWVLLGLWAVLVFARRAVERGAAGGHTGTVAALLALMSLAHVLYHHPSSAAGLWGGLLIAVLGLLSPVASWRPDTAEQRLLAGLPLLAPAWLVFFSQAPLLEEGAAGAFRAWPVLATAATLLAMGWAAYLYQEGAFESWEAPVARPARLFDQTAVVLGTRGAALRAAAMLVAFATAAAVQLSHYGRPYAPRTFVLFCGLWVALAVCWFQEGRRRGALGAHVLAQLSVFALFSLVRRQLTLTTDFWTPEYDVWMALLVSLALTGAKPWLDRQAREMRLPALVSLCALPVAALSWTLIQGLGSDTALVLVGLYSVMFAYLGSEERDSPYNLVAVAGFVAFVLIVFWSKLELRVVHAYVIPVGLGVLALLQLAGDALASSTRNLVRGVTLLAMLGSAGYYALVDERYPVAFNVTLLLLCLAAMGLGSLLRIRLYLVLGATGVAVDLASIVFKVLVHMDRGPRMTAVGMLVLLLGAALVGGAIYYKTHRETFDAAMESWRRHLAEWE
jgi:hypothetical protein